MAVIATAMGDTPRAIEALEQTAGQRAAPRATPVDRTRVGARFVIIRESLRSAGTQPALVGPRRIPRDHQSSRNPIRAIRGGTMVSGRRKEGPDAQLTFCSALLLSTLKISRNAAT